MAESESADLEDDCTVIDGNNLVLVCVDACNHSLRAFNWYLKYFYQTDQKLALIHVYTRPEMIQAGYTPEMWHAAYSDIMDDELQKSVKVTDKFLQICKDKGLQAKVHHLAKVDSVGQTICNYAKEKDAACVVLGQRGLGALKRTVFGSVSEYVLHHAHIPVVIVPPPKGHKCQLST